MQKKNENNSIRLIVISRHKAQIYISWRVKIDLARSHFELVKFFALSTHNDFSIDRKHRHNRRMLAGNIVSLFCSIHPHLSTHFTKRYMILRAALSGVVIAKNLFSSLLGCVMNAAFMLVALSWSGWAESRPHAARNGKETLDDGVSESAAY